MCGVVVNNCADFPGAVMDDLRRLEHHVGVPVLGAVPQYSRKSETVCV